MSTPLAKYQSTTAFSTLDACQAVDTQCKCPTLRTCWMYNTTTSPCCVQGNPKDPLFAGFNTPLLITKDQNTCVNQATKCAKWRFNGKDVPCCIQRSQEQWNARGYSSSGVQVFDTKAECDAAASTSCTFSALLHPPTTLNDYYGTILENQYTTGCEALRAPTNGIWWGSNPTSCSSDASPVDCGFGNCGYNYCNAWVPNNPFFFTQQVRCLPSSETCCNPSQKQVFSNQGTQNATAKCE